MLSLEPMMVRSQAELSDEGMERAVLASLMAYPGLMAECVERLKAEDFLNTNNAYLYLLMYSIFRRNAGKDCTFDTATLLSLAREKGAEKSFLEKSGGDQYIEYLNIVKNTMISPQAFTGYVDKVCDLSIKRAVLLMTRDIERNIFTSDKSPDELMIYGQDQYEKLFSGLSNKGRELVNLGEHADGLIEEAVKHKKSILGIPTQFPKLDQTIEGLKRGELIVVCAPRKVGKTTFMTNIAINVGIKQDIPVLYVSTEMSDKEIFFKVVSNLSNVEEKKIKKGQMNPNEFQLVSMAKVRVKEGKFLHVPLRQFTVETLSGLIRKFVNNVVGYDENGKTKDCLVVFDYIKLPQEGVSKDSKEYKILGQISDSLKCLAGDLDIPILTACQTNRAGGIANSYEITWFCNVFMELTNKDEKEINSDKEKGIYSGNQRLKITANRGGDEDHVGIDLEYFKPVLRYQEIHRKAS